MMLGGCGLRLDCGPVGRVYLADDAAPKRSVLAHPERAIDGGMAGLSCDWRFDR